MTAHPGFGSFLKEHKEFFNALDEEGWEAVPGFDGIESKVLSGAFDHENRTGCVTKLSRWAPGTVVSKPNIHDWCEEVLFISGSLSIGSPDNEEATWEAGTYAVRPADVPHGPFFTKDGCVMIEFLYYPPKG